MRKLLTPFLIFSSCICYAQKIKGVITDSSGKVLPFASVFIKGTNTGTHSNSEGKFSLTLSPGKYTLVCQYVGYRKDEKQVTITDQDIVLDFKLTIQELTLAEVIIKNGEDPAYAIIRKTIKERKKHEAELDKYQCEVYTKGQIRLRDYPNKILGKKVDFEDGDTSKKKMLFLSETISNFSVDKPNKVKVEVISSKVSGQTDGFGLSAPGFFSFYENIVRIGNLNPRGFISPISENALNYYKYKLEGTYFEDGREICHIKVIPKRKYEPLFSGHIDIVADEWRVHSVKLLLLKESQMEIVDTLRIEQLYRPVDKDRWFISSQVMYPAIKLFGFDTYGSFVNIYSKVNLDPDYNKKSFDKTIVKYLDSSNKKTADYWEKTRPVPLMDDEALDYKKKDSLEQVRKDPRYLDSLDRKRNKFSLLNTVVLGTPISNSKKRSVTSIEPLTEIINFNPAEGWVFNPAFTWSKRLDTTSTGRRSISISPSLRYGFANNHFNPSATIYYGFGKKYFQAFRISGGSRVFQFNPNSPIGQRGNTISSLLSEKNRIKSYEAVYFRGSYWRGVGAGMTVTGAFQFQDRKPLDNVTDYTWRDKEGRAYTPNYPAEIMSSNISRHQVFMMMVGMTFQPGSKYVELPGRKMNVGSKYPVFNLQYYHAFKDVLGSDAHFSKWRLGISDGINLKLFGRLRYRIGFGGFLDTGNVQVPDYIHFNGNVSTLAADYVNSFQLMRIYRYSNLERFYSLAHIEHNFNGFLTNKIPGVRNLNIYLVAGMNGMYIRHDRYYFEWFLGVDNIFKQVRVDFIQSYEHGHRPFTGIRIGLRGGLGRRGDDWP